MRTIFAVTCLAFLIYSCDEEVTISFEETLIETEKDAKISIAMPLASGKAEVADNINNTLQTYVANLNLMDKDSTIYKSFNDAVEKFNLDYNSFISDFPENSRKWEFFVDGEVTYRSPELISIAINSYTDTGGAHGNTIIRFFNFDAQTGKVLNKQDLIKDLKSFSKLTKDYLEEETALKNGFKETSGGDMQDYFFGQDFQLPETIGFSDEGVIILYNTYEIASYAQGITEFTIPFSEIEETLSVR